ncbi:MAG: N-acetyltransferase [Candidatus Jettenia sp. CY-1]|uniref:N-acetylglutamate synthase n=1 Tax=Candidatus Jettenia ecosi TaxID=2494326 RepID=A0A533Q708_9BACT|nr:N-acetyltransferase [Candidatus Jettenia sp.]TLD40396.1 MAG: N-acetylglutamate synthase [Candidatus Jettenia ecosi]WKZ19789.1 MAG: N-acetyltransferase [Candidatus Jettenia sp. CY-1]
MLRKATIEDIEKIYKLINEFASKNVMLPRSLSELYENIRDFFVFIQHDKVVGCAALHIFWKDLAEIKSIAVLESHQHGGIGKKLVMACKREASKLHIAKIFALTYVPEFFEKCGFIRVEKESLPHKIWSECVKCHKFPDCGEIPVIYELQKTI